MSSGETGPQKSTLASIPNCLSVSSLLSNMERGQNREPAARELWLNPNIEECLAIFEYFQRPTEKSRYTYKQTRYWYDLGEHLERTKRPTPEEKPMLVFLYWKFIGFCDAWEWPLDTIFEEMSKHRAKWEEEENHKWLERDPGYMGYLEYLMAQSYTPPPFALPKGS